MKADEILSAAEAAVVGERATTYGDMQENMAMISRLWNVYLEGGRLIDAKDAAIMLGLVKIARMATGGKKLDNFVDLAGYAAIAGQVSHDDDSL